MQLALARSRAVVWLPAAPLLWLVLLVVWLASRALCPLVGIEIHVYTGQPVFIAVILASSVLVRSLLAGAKSFAILLESVAFLAAIPFAIAPMTYLATRSPLPAGDDLLRAADSLVGVDAALWRGFVEHHAMLVWPNIVLYGCWMPQIVIAAFLLPIVGDGLRGIDMVRQATLALLVTSAICFLLPAAGTMPQQENWFADWSALRQFDTPFTIDSTHIQPIVSFPSFHACSAVLLTYAFRGFGKLSWAAGALNVGMALSAIAVGCHYLADILVGAAVGYASVSMMRIRPSTEKL